MSRVLSIQSHVVHGYVGNKSAVFPLQVLGFEVDPVNSVQFSNHTGYRNWKGHILDSDKLGDLYTGLKDNDLNHYSHVLTGYIGSSSFLYKVKEVILDLKKINPDLVYVCDPVMGDNGKLYVPEELLPIYRENIIPHADIVTPNQFEAELLSGVKIHDMETAKQAMQKIHEMGARTVILSSSDLGNEDYLIGLGSCVNNGSHISIKIQMPRFPAHFTGTGDLFAALLLAWMHEHSSDMKLACEKTVATMQAVLKRTLDSAQEGAGPGVKPSLRQMELKLIQSKKDIESPQVTIRAEEF